MTGLLQKVKNRIQDKLRQRKGVTVVFALVVFMIAALISTTIVNVSLANLSRANSRKSNEQARLAVVSATKYLESDELDEPALKTALGALTAADIGQVWTVKVNDTAADAALSTTITWTDITPGSVLTAVVQSGDYRVQIRMNYSGSKWNITRLKKF